YLKYIQQLEQRKILLGFRKLDKHLRGIAPGEVCEVIARTGVGKTAFLLNVMKQVIVNQKIPVLFFSLEQPLAQIYERTIQIAAEVDGWRVEKNYTQPETAKTLHMLSKQNYSQLYIVDEDFLTYEELKEFIQIAEREKIGSRPPLVCVDYLGRMKGGGHSPYEVTSELAKQLKVLAKDLDIAILYLHQTSRMGKSGAEKISLDMARDSGVTEEAADFIIGMWRPELNNEQAQERDHEELSVAILKNRKGSIGQASFKFIKPYLKICEWEDDGSAGNVKYWDQ
ncbi:MAG: DnaB helicase C-terminal domain-containing protein, partial [Limnochordia bacterium]|nr:DnaB helicase C-terminal domain-containing protein [Limnochordia bacterium]